MAVFFVSTINRDKHAPQCVYADEGLPANKLDRVLMDVLCFCSECSRMWDDRSGI